MGAINNTIETRIWLKGLLEGYYGKLDRLNPPEALQQREFGFGSLTKKVTLRHRAFSGERELLEYVKKEAPAHINHSLARYEFPGEENMTDKRRLGADLIFDIDVGDLELKHAHAKDWVCERCFDALKNEAMKLLDFLGDDFGFSEKELSVNFSGSRGYHVRIRNDKLLELGEAARKEICAYLSMESGLDELIYERNDRIFGPRPDEGGLKGRVARTMIETVKKLDIGNKEHLINQLREGNWGAFPKGYGLKRILKLARNSALRIPVDSKVTTDLTHMIRMVDTIHGGSLMLAKSVRNIDSFNPLDECFVFGDEEKKVEFTMDTPSLIARDQSFGPFKKGPAKIPEFLAAYYGAKGRCTLIGSG